MNKKKKKVCMIVQNSTVKGGIAAVINGYRGSKLEKDYDIIYVESYKDGRKITKLLKGIKGYVHFVKVLLIDRPELIHIQSSFGKSFYRKLPFIYMSVWAKKPIINHIHGADFDKFYVNSNENKRKLIKSVYGKCDYLIALSDEWKELLSQIVPVKKIKVIENYSIICKEAYEQRMNRRANNTVLFLGEIGKRKGCYDIPEVVEKVASEIPDVKFLLGGVGSKDDESAIKKLIEYKKVTDHVSFPGWVRGKKKDELLRKADIFFLPSYNEGMPMSVLDAMGYGLPIVSTNVGGIPNIVRNDVNGYCYTPGDNDGMAEGIVKLLNEEKRRVCSRESYEIVSKSYSLESHLREIECLYEVILE